MTRLARGTVLHVVGDRSLAAEEPGGLTLYCQADEALEPRC